MNIDTGLKKKKKTFPLTVIVPDWLRQVFKNTFWAAIESTAIHSLINRRD